MAENKMYSERKGNIPVIRYCAFQCVYCGFQKFQKISKCQDCRANKNHSHLEVLSRTPPNTKKGEFITVGLSGDVSFMAPEDFWQVIEYCKKWKDRTFLIQSKDPEYFVSYRSKVSQVLIPNNVILGTTIESDYWCWDDLYYDSISKAPFPMKRLEAMVKLNCRKAITIEPILSFSDRFWGHLIKASPEFIYIGYANDKNKGTKLKLPEPTLEKTIGLIADLREAGIEVREKTLRKAWWE
jgi:hypothetical protein